MTDRSDCRLLIADTDATNELFSDAEIDTFLTLGTSVYGAAAIALRSQAADLCRTYDMKLSGGGGGVTIDTKGSALRLLELADKYEKLDRESFEAEIVDWKDPDLDMVEIVRRDARFDQETTSSEFDG